MFTGSWICHIKIHANFVSYFLHNKYFYSGALNDTLVECLLSVYKAMGQLPSAWEMVKGR